MASEPWDGAPEAGASGGRPGEGGLPGPGPRRGPARPGRVAAQGLRVHVADREFRLGDERVPAGHADPAHARESGNAARRDEAVGQGPRPADPGGRHGTGRRRGPAGRAARPLGAAAQSRPAGRPARQLHRRAHLVSVRPGPALSGHAGRRQQSEPPGAARVQCAGAARRRLRRPRGAGREGRGPSAAVGQRGRHADSDQAGGRVGHAEDGRAVERPAETETGRAEACRASRRQTSRPPTRRPRLPAQPADPSPGVFLRAECFGEHWLTFGCGETLDVFYQGNVILTPPAFQGPQPGHVPRPSPTC